MNKIESLQAFKRTTSLPLYEVYLTRGGDKVNIARSEIADKRSGIANSSFRYANGSKTQFKSEYR